MADETRPKYPVDDAASNRPQPQRGALEIETFVESDEAGRPDVSPRKLPAEETPNSSDPRQPPPSRRELIGILCLIVLCDVTIYRGEGFAGYALLFSLGPLLLWFSSSLRCAGPAVWIVSAMLAALAVKLLCCGSHALAAIGFALVVAFAMAIAGFRPYVLEALFFALRTLDWGYTAIVEYGRRINRLGPVVPKSSWISVLLPVLALLVFGWIFVLANPALTDLFGQGIRQFFDALERWARRFSPDLLELGFWLAVLWVVAGLLRPAVDRAAIHSSANGSRRDDETAPTEAFLFPAFRNTLTTVIVLFAVYLVFEFQTLWFRKFEPGFHYSGYAHEGAAWLTAALALATLMLSLVFRGSILRDPRVGTLRKLAWLWSLENMILAAAVFNRLFIYIGFNGMTRMRIVALYGISAVLVGFVLVVWKIVHSRDFLWLVRRHLWTLAIAIYLLAMTPLDTVVVSYNVRRILAGDPAPSVQISVHPINPEGILLLEPLLESENEIIREGVRALLAEHHVEAEARVARRTSLGWTAYQLADRIAVEGLREQSARWQRYADEEARRAAFRRFSEYAYQWY